MKSAGPAARRIALSVGVAVSMLALAGHAPSPRPGPAGDGVTLLPSGWRIAPAGRHVTLGNLPLALVESPDGRQLIVSNNGYSRPTLAIVDLER
ncbi:MAG: hypothetical protein ACRD1P_11770, partial [Thermoanaerobaculia bacterium]